MLRIFAKMRNRNWITVAVKLTSGVALVSNLCIGTLLFANWSLSTRLDERTRELMTIKDNLNSDLRHTVLEIQENYLNIPAFFNINPKGEILAWITKNHTLLSDDLLEGRASYTPFYGRKARRDLAKGEVVISAQEGGVAIGIGIDNEAGEFSDSVRRLVVSGGERSREAFKAHIQEIMAQNSNDVALKSRIAQLGAKLADEGLKAEETRNRILQVVDDITRREKQLSLEKDRSRRLTAFLGIATVAVNVIALYVMVWLIVERPLRRLSSVITRIRGGEAPDIPYQTRRDEIGALAGTVKSFGDALIHLRLEDERKQQEQAVVSDTIQVMTTIITQQREGSREMTLTASQLNALATDAREQSATVTQTASRTAENTMAVSEAAEKLCSSARNTLAELERQNYLVRDIAVDTRGTRENIDSLTTASEAIGSIISVVRDIADRTRLLALNATIEAARAGEKGKGFAVVALEVKELSRQTEQATRDVARKITSISNETQNILGSIGNIDGKVEHLMEISGSVTDIVNAQLKFTEEIAVMTATASSETHDVSQRISQVEEAAVNTLELSGRVHEHSETLSVSMAQLLDETTRRLTSLGSRRAA